MDGLTQKFKIKKHEKSKFENIVLITASITFIFVFWLSCSSENYKKDTNDKFGSFSSMVYKNHTSGR